jgi:hypothetical protein
MAIRAGRCRGIVVAALLGTVFFAALLQLQKDVTFAALSHEAPRLDAVCAGGQCGKHLPKYHAILLSQKSASHRSSEALVCSGAQPANRERHIIGQVCLRETAPVLATTAVYWRDNQRREIGGFGGDVSVATAVNNHNVVVGYANTANVPAIRGFRWSEAKGVEALPRLVDGVPAEPMDINDAGVVVGRAGTSFFANEPVYWDAHGAIHQLPRLYKTSDVGVLAINNHGVMVGQELAPDFEPEARLWLNGRVYRLQDLVPNLPDGYRLRAATSVNDAGDIVANASVPEEGQVRIVTLLLKADPASR